MNTRTRHPRRHKLHILRFRLWRKLIQFAVAPFPTNAQLLWGPQLSASLGFGGGPIFCRPNLSHFCAAYGRLPKADRLGVCAPTGAPKCLANLGIPRGRRGQSVRMQEAGGRRGNCRTVVSRTPEREGRSATERGDTQGGYAPLRAILWLLSHRGESNPSGASRGFGGGTPKCPAARRRRTPSGVFGGAAPLTRRSEWWTYPARRCGTGSAPPGRGP